MLPASHWLAQPFDAASVLVGEEMACASREVWLVRQVPMALLEELCLHGRWRQVREYECARDECTEVRRGSGRSTKVGMGSRCVPKSLAHRCDAACGLSVEERQEMRLDDVAWNVEQREP